MFVTRVGTGTVRVVAPTAACPESLYPQQYASPLAVTAQAVSVVDGEMAAKAFADAIGSGVFVSSFAPPPVPSWPDAFHPQHAIPASQLRGRAASRPS